MGRALAPFPRPQGTSNLQDGGSVAVGRNSASNNPISDIITSMDFLLETHSGLRWLVLVALISVLVIGLGKWNKDSSHHPALVSVTSILLDVQALLGIILLVANGTWDDLFHPVVMLIAVGVFKIGKIRTAKVEEPIRGKRLTAVTVLTLVVILVGIYL